MVFHKLPRTHREVKTFYSINALWKLDIHMKNDSGLLFHLYTKLSWNKELKLRHETVKLLTKVNKTIKKRFHDIGAGNEVLEMTPNGLATKEKVHKWDCLKPKRILHSHGNYQQWGNNVNSEETTYGKKKITAKYSSDKGSTVKVFK